MATKYPNRLAWQTDVDDKITARTDVNKVDNLEHGPLLHNVGENIFDTEALADALDSRVADIEGGSTDQLASQVPLDAALAGHSQVWAYLVYSDSQLNQNTSDIASNKSDITGHESRIAAIEGGSVDQNAAEVPLSPAVGLYTEVQAGIAGLDTRLDGAENKLAGIEDGATADQMAIDVPLSPLVNGQDNCQAALQVHETTIGQNQANIGVLDGRVAAIEGGSVDQNAEEVPLSPAVGGYAELQASTTGHENRIAALEGQGPPAYEASQVTVNPPVDGAEDVQTALEHHDNKISIATQDAADVPVSPAVVEQSDVQAALERLEFLVSLSMRTDEVPTDPVGHAKDCLGAWGSATKPVELVVTNTNDTGTGSLREALTTPGPRVVRYSPSLEGQTITLESPINIADSYMSWLGNDARVVVASNSDTSGVTPIRINWTGGSDPDMVDIFIKDIRIRPGEGALPAYGGDIDGVLVGNVDLLYMQNCSFSLTCDETVQYTRDTKRVTMDRCILAMAAREAHASSNHHFGAYLFSYNELTINVSFYRCLMANNHARNPNFWAGGACEVVECWIHDCYYMSQLKVDSGDANPTQVSYLGNLVTCGPGTVGSTTQRGLIGTSGSRGDTVFHQAYAADNLLQDAVNLTSTHQHGHATLVGSNFSGNMTEWLKTPILLETLIPDEVGARPLDAGDTMIIQCAQERSGGGPISADRFNNPLWGLHVNSWREPHQTLDGATFIPTDNSLTVRTRFKVNSLGNGDGSHLYLAGCWNESQAGGRSWAVVMRRNYSSSNYQISALVSGDGDTTDLHTSTDSTGWADDSWHDLEVVFSGNPITATITIDGQLQTTTDLNNNSPTGFFNTAEPLRCFAKADGTPSRGQYDNQSHYALDGLQLEDSSGVRRDYTMNRTLADSGTDASADLVLTPAGRTPTWVMSEKP